ncbi:MAG TPA: hypothetical protein PL033_02605 [Candidatus Brocadiia bacterium]|nr:hypothetical protein [Candidatus Brocadiia bacterium]
MPSRFIIHSLAVFLCAALCQAEAQENIAFEDREYRVISNPAEPTFVLCLNFAGISKPDPETRVLFGFKDQNNLYSLDVTPRGYGLRRIENGRAKILAGCAAEPFSGQELEIFIKRELFLISVYAQGRVVLEAFDDTFGSGKIAVFASGIALTDKVRCQETVPLRFGDDFRRADNEAEISQSWVVKRGTWKLHSIVEDVDNINVSSLPASRRPDAVHSPNPFSMNASTADWALLLGGQWFWCDYDARVSVTNPGGVMGLVFDYRGDDDFFLLRWKVERESPSPSKMEIVRVKAGEQQVLAGAWVTGRTNQWYRIGIRTLGRRVDAFLDDAPVMSVEHESAFGGMIGLYSEVKENATFDDVSVSSTTVFPYTNRRWVREYTKVLKGEWDFAMSALHGMPSAAVMRLKNGDGSLLFGPTNRGSIVASCRVEQPGRGESVGIILDYKGDGTPYHEVLWRGPANGDKESRIQLVKRSAEGRRVLMESQPPRLLPGDTHELLVDLRSEREIRACVDDWTALRMRMAEPSDGSLGLVGSAVRPLHFADVCFAFQRNEDIERQPTVEVFQSDPFMQHWSSPKGAWWPQWDMENAYWHVGDFYGRSVITLPAAKGVMLIHCASMIDVKGGYAIRIEERDSPAKPEEKKEAQKLPAVVLYRLGKEVQSAFIPVGADGKTAPAVEIHKDESFLWITSGGQEIITFQDGELLKSTRVALKSETPVDLSTIKIFRTNVEDHYFESAPTGWEAVGKWAVMNRFVCDPRWSHMVGKSLESAILWDRTQFYGDMTIESHTGMRMQRGDLGLNGNYPRIGDLNMAIFTDGRSLDSGYNFVLQAWDPWWSEVWSRLLRFDQVVQRTDREFIPKGRDRPTQERTIRVPWISTGRPVHGAWYYLKARRQGNQVSYLFDNEAVFDYYDREPLAQWGSPAIWTLYNSIVVARVKISYQHKRTPGALCAPPPENAPKLPDPLPNLVVTSETHPAAVFDFESGIQGWKKVGDYNSAEVRLEPREGGTCLSVSNNGTGGMLGAQTDLLYHVPARRAVVEFDYKLNPGTRINFYADAGGTRYYARMNCPDDFQPNLVKLGEIEGVKDDGKWRNARFVIHEPFARVAPMPQKEEKINSIAFGNLHTGYLWAGMGGNPNGSGYCVDNVRVYSVGGPEAKFVWNIEGQPNAPFSVTVSPNPNDAPPQQEGVHSKLQELTPGLKYLHMSAKIGETNWTPVRHLPFIVADSLAESGSEPAHNGDWNLSMVTVGLKPDSAQLDLSKCKLKLKGAELSFANSRIAAYDPKTRKIALDPAAAGLSFSDGEKVALKATLTDVIGGALEIKCEFTARRKLDRTPPLPARITNLNAGNPSAPPLPYRFFDTANLTEQGMASMGDAYGSRIIADPQRVPGGRGVCVYNALQGGHFGTYLTPQTFSAGRFPLLAFDYAVNRGVALDVEVPAGRYALIAFTDQSPGTGRNGQVQSVTQDGRWHRAEVDLQKALSVQQFVPNHYRVSGVRLKDSGHMENAPFGYVLLDNLTFVPVAGGESFGPIQWEAADCSGIKGYSCLWSQNPEEEAPQKITHESPETVFTNLAGPEAYLHIRAVDNAGNWGPTAHFRFRIDSQSPVFGKPSPAPEEPSASNEIIVPISDVGSGVDPETLSITIDGKPCQLGSAGASYDLGRGMYLWDWRVGRPQDQTSIPNGKRVDVSATVKDFAGNTSQPLNWAWVMDYAKDKTPPSAPTIKCSSLKILQRDEFLDSAGGWQQGDGTSRIQLVQRGKLGPDQCLHCSLATPGPWKTVARAAPYNPAEFPIISFSYTIPAEVKIDLHVHANGKWYTVAFTGGKSAFEIIGQLQGVSADSQWHTAWVDLNALLQAREELKGKPVQVSAVCFGDFLTALQGNQPNFAFHIDDFMISSAGPAAAAFAWSALDITGIKAYSVVLDQSPMTDPPAEAVRPEAGGTLKAPQTGACFLHVKAQDNGGNWGDASHHFYYFAQ